MDLNPEQSSVVSHVMGPLLVLAPAGSGKTALLASRIQEALKSGFSPQDMLCLTFTNLAARQLRARVEQSTPALAEKIWMGTFHGFCTSLLRIESGRVGLPGDFVIYDEEDSAELMEQLMGEHQLTQMVKPDSRNAKDRYYHAAELLSLLEQAKALACGEDLSLTGFAGGTYPDERLSLLFEHYSRELSARHAFDFSDLIYYVRAVFHRHKELREQWANRFQFIQVDEIQDTHLAEYSVIRTMARSQNIAFYGDLDQSIYGWRGATPFRVRDGFLRDFSPTIYSLPVNYRATKMLIGAADSFAQRAYVRRCTRLVPAPACSPGTPVVIHQVEDEELEGAWIGEQILKHMASSKCSYRNIAVLCRSNQKAEELGTILSRMAVPCITADQYNFFRRQEIKDMMAFLRLLLNPYDLAAAQRMDLRYGGGIEMADRLAQFRASAAVVRPPQLVKDMIDAVGLMKAFESEPKHQANLRHLLTLFEEHDSPALKPMESLKAIVQYASLAKHLDQLSEKEDKVIVAPIYQSKGLEFDVVFIAGAVDGAMPHFYATDQEEEKRLFYVAMTRPKVALFISGYRTKMTSSGVLIKKKMTPYIQSIAKAYVDYRPVQGEAALRHPVESKYKVILLRIRRFTARWFWWR